MNNGSKKAILLVEDEALIAMSEKMSLERYGYAVTTVRTGEKAVDFMKTGAPIDLILMDIDLGAGIDGSQAAEVILQDHDIPVVFLSSHTEPEIVEKTEKITSYGYIVKNSSITVLDASIKMAFRLFEANKRLTDELTDRKRTERALQESEEKFRALFEKGPIGVAYHEMVYDDSGKAIDYRFIDANSSYIELTGVDPRGKRVTEAFPGIEDDPFDWIGTFGRVAKTGEQIRFEQYLQPNDRWYDCVGYQVRPDHFVAAFVQITKRKQTEEALKMSEERFRVAQELSPDGFTILHPERDSEGKIIDFSWRYENPAIARINGTVPEEVIGKHLLDVLPGHQSTPIFEAYLNVAYTGNTRVMEEISARDILSRQVWLRLVVVSMGEDIAVLAQDITERQRLRRSTELQSKLLQNIGQAVIATNLQGEVIYWNQMAETVYGWSSIDAIGKNILDLTPASQTKEQAADIMKKLTQGETWSGEFAVQSKGGSSFPAYVTNTPILNDEGALIGIIGISTDITQRKANEARLSDYQWRLESIIEGTQVGTWQWNVQTGELTLDENWAAIVGYTLEELQPVTIQTWERFALEDDLDKSAELLNRHFSGELPYYNAELRMRHKDGHVVWVRDRGKVASWTDQEKPILMFGTHADITEEKAREQELTDQKQYLETILETASDGFWVLSPDKRITSVNAAYCRMSGYSVAELARMSINDLDATESPQESTERVKRIAENGSGTFETKHRRKDGSLLDVEIAASRLNRPDGTYLVAFCRDISERKQAEGALFESERRYRSVEKAAALGIWEMDIATGKSFWSDEFFRICGYEPGSIVPNSDTGFFIIHDDDKDRAAQAVTETIDTGKPYSIEKRIVRPDGETRWVHSIGEVEFDEDGTAKTLVGSFQDITERKLDQEEIQKQLSEKETLLREVHHRVKNNIGTIESFLSLQIGDLVFPEAKAALQDAISRVRSMRVLYEKLLLDKNLHEVSIKGYAESLLDSLLMVFDPQRHITVETHIADFEVASRKAVSIGIMINELLTNVFKYAFKNRDSGMVSVSIDKEEDNVTLIIQDDGVGIDERIMENKSPGLGLTIVRMLAEQLEGTYSIANDNGARSVLQLKI